MTLEYLQRERISAMKNKDKTRQQVLSEMIDAVQKASITQNGRVEITEQLVDEVLIKYQKMAQEMIDKCPASRVDKLNEYTTNMAIVKEYVPQLITDEAEISFLIGELIVENPIAMTKANRGSIMCLVSSSLKGKVDMGVAAKVVSSLLG